jgi:hypothetical protein
VNAHVIAQIEDSFVRGEKAGMKSDTTGAFVHNVPMIGYAKASEVVSSTLITVLIMGFYMAHYFLSTGFFTSTFTPPLATLFFASVIYTMLTNGAKAATPRKDMVALVELIGAGLLALTAYWFYLTFPLDFGHVADVVPTQLQFLLTWISNDIGRIIVAIALVGALIALAVDAVKLAWRVSERQYRGQERY